MDSLSRELMHLGLSEKEAAVYVAALQLGPVPVQDIAKQSKVNRATTYVMIESLEKRGLISSTIKDKKRIFIAEAPDRLLSLIRLQKKELEEQENEMAHLLPKLNALFNRSGEKPEVRYLEGVEGLEMLRREFEKLNGETIQIVGYDAFTKAMDHEPTIEHRETLRKKRSLIRAIHVTERSRADLATQFEDLGDVLDFRVVHPKDFPFKVQGEITVREDVIDLFTYTASPLAIEVRSAILADTLRGLFELAWKGAK
ncbi:MAG: helix-turn-helix domain-containing protein [Patescibacteria group bacterium]